MAARRVVSAGATTAPKASEAPADGAPADETTEAAAGEATEVKAGEAPGLNKAERAKLERMADAFDKIDRLLLRLAQQGLQRMSKSSADELKALEQLAHNAALISIERQIETLGTLVAETAKNPDDAWLVIVTSAYGLSGTSSVDGLPMLPESFTVAAEYTRASEVDGGPHEGQSIGDVPEIGNGGWAAPGATTPLPGGD